jgi:dipeptidase D
MSFVAELEPNSLWSHFDAILKIPRASGKEERIRDHVVSVAGKNGLECKVDTAGNVVVYKPGTAGHENAPTTVIQAHLDMVQQKNSDVSFDFDNDAIEPQRDGEYVKATGTTLGSDNGIGVASMMAVMEAKDVRHGPLELLFTVDEETGLTGASNLGDGLLQGRLLLNVDSEEEGVLTIGCAGGADSHVYLPLSKEAAPAVSKALAIRLFGLKGGHSGIDIHLQRGNAGRLLARALYAVSLKHAIRVADLQGGNAHNAIPREATAAIVVAEGADRIQDLLHDELESIRNEFRPAEPDMQFSVDVADAVGQVWTAESTTKGLQLIVGLPHGVEGMSYDIKGLVETSTNEAVIKEDDDRLSILMSSRSSEASALAALRQRIRAIAALSGANVEEDDGYPGWKPDVSSHLLDVLKEVHEQVTGNAPEVGAVHAGLECGIIGEKYPGMDMISFGPQIEFPHSPDERVKVDSVGVFYQLLTRTLERLTR